MTQQIERIAVDLTNPDSFVERVPHDAFAAMRAQPGLYRQDEPDGGRGFWAITRYDDIVAASNDAAIFSSAKGTNFQEVPEEALPLLQALMLNMDPPRHTEYRRLVAKGFTPQMTRAMEPHVREIAASILDAVAARGECDFVTDMAAELPLQVIAELIGIPHEERHQIFEWSNRLIGTDDPEFGTTMEQARDGAMQMFLYANNLAVERKKEPKQDLVSTLVAAEVGGEVMSEPDFDAFFLLLSVAGNETTRNLISGGMLTLFEHPDQLTKLAADPSLMPAAVEEMLRWITPVMYFRRTATQASEIAGTKIEAGEKVALYYISGNRDEAAFERAGDFDIERSPNPHMAFGAGGPHFCLGASLARLEIRVMFEEVLRRFPDIAQAGPAQRLRSNFISGIKHLPVRFTAQGA